MLKHVTLSLALLAAAAASAFAQNAPGTVTQPGQPRQGAAGAQPGAPGAQAAQAGNLDHEIAAMIALGNQEEITLAQLAEQRAKHERVKEFAQMMQRDHTQALQKLQQVAPQVASLRLTGATAGGARGQAPNQPGSTVQQAGGQQQFGAQGGVQPAGSTQAIAGGASPRIDLFRAIHAQCLALTQRELEEAGEDFDACYVGQQVGAHIAMLAKLQASEQYATGELRNFIQEATQTVEGHLQHAKELAKELKNAQASNGAAQRDEATRR
jgi:predicted outer membrane protein